MRDDHRLSRRQALGVLGSLGTGAALGVTRLGGAAGTAEAAAACVLSPEVTEGPYWIDNRLTRRDITEDRPGLPLELVLTVQDARTCEPDRGRRRRDLALRRRRGLLRLRERLAGRRRSTRRPAVADRRGALPARAPARRRRGPRPLSHDLSGLVPRAYAAHPPEGPRRRRRRAHRAAVLPRVRDRRGLPAGAVSLARPARHEPRRRPDLRAGGPVAGRRCGSPGAATGARATAGRSRSGWRPSRSRRGAGRRRSACGRDRA
jgi:hypothetical protein